MILLNDLWVENGVFAIYWYVFADVLYLELTIEEWLYHSGVK